MTIEVVGLCDQKMRKTIASFVIDLGKVRTGRAHTGLIDHIQVEYYGNPTPINQVGNVTLVDSRTIGIQVWEKNMLSVVEKAIRESDLGLNPSTSGDMVRIPMPPLTQERRKELCKVVKNEGETAKVAIRNARRDGNEQLKKNVKDKLISEDEERRFQDEIQKLTDKSVAEIDRLVSEKEKEIMTI